MIVQRTAGTTEIERIKLETKERNVKKKSERRSLRARASRTIYDREKSHTSCNGPSSRAGEGIINN